MPPTSPGLAAIWCRWSTPTRWTGSSNGSWTGRNAPPTWADTSRSHPTEPAESASRAAASAEDGALLKAALMPLTAPAPAVDEHDGLDGELVRDPRDAGARMWDALVQTAQHALDTDLPPDSHGAPARLMVTTTLDSLRRPGWPTTPSTSSRSRPSGGWRVTPRSSPPSSARKSEPLDVGRAKRLVTLAIWAALVIRDRHCAFPGCDRPPLMCHAHHIVHWISGGETKLSNLVLLCGHHHRVIHHSPWEVRINPDDHRPEFLPPPKPGAARHWIRYRPRRE